MLFHSNYFTFEFLEDISLKPINSEGADKVFRFFVSGYTFDQTFHWVFFSLDFTADVRTRVLRSCTRSVVWAMWMIISPGRVSSLLSADVGPSPHGLIFRGLTHSGYFLGPVDFWLPFCCRSWFNILERKTYGVGVFPKPTWVNSPTEPETVSRQTRRSLVSSWFHISQWAPPHRGELGALASALARVISVWSLTPSPTLWIGHIPWTGETLVSYSEKQGFSKHRIGDKWNQIK